MICYLDSCRDKTLKLCSPEKFRELTESQRTSMLITAFRSGENPQAKSQLPAFVFMGYDPDLLEGKPGKRLKASLKPTGLVMFDFDHISKTVIHDEKTMTPYDLYDRFLKLMPHFGFTLENDLALAHVTPSGDGLRIVMKIRKGKTIAETQKRVGEMLGIECDKAVKDLSRLSFCPMASDILYINKQLLFQPIKTDKNENTNNSTAGQRPAGDGELRRSSSDSNQPQPRCEHGQVQPHKQEVPPATEPSEHGVPQAESRGEKQPQDAQQAPQDAAASGHSHRTGSSEPNQSSGQRNDRDETVVREDSGFKFQDSGETDGHGRPVCYHGVPYKTIVEKWIELRGGTPEPGDRHATLVELAMDLRKICDNDKDWIASLMPDFDKGEEEKLDCIEWAVGRQHSKISGTLLQTLQDLGIVAPEIQKYRTTEIQKFRNTESSESSVQSSESESLPPQMPEELPSLVKLLTSKVLDHQKPAVASMIFPALATHVNNCLFKLRDNTDVELSLMCCLLATQSAGKGCVKAPLRLIMQDIKTEDKVNRQRERQWQESQKNKKANEKGASRPDDIIIRILSSDTTPAAFLGRLFAAEHGDGQSVNLCTYSQVDEIEDLYRFCSSGGRNMVQQMIKRTWDRDDIGAERWSANSANISTVLRWNWAASSTIEGGKKFFKNCLTDGTTSRVDFCTIIPPTKVIDFCYGDYDEDFEDDLKPYIENLKAFRCEKTDGGRVIPKLFPQIREIEERMNAYINDTASTMPDETWANYAWRAKVMAIKKLIVLYIANGCTWEQSFEPFTWWAFHYNMWCKMNLFYDAASAAFQEERIRGDKGHKSPLKYMKREFTYAEFATVCQQHGFKQNPEMILRKYKYRGVVAFREDNTYVIEPNYAKKFGIQ